MSNIIANLPLKYIGEYIHNSHLGIINSLSFMAFAAWPIFAISLLMLLTARLDYGKMVHHYEKAAIGGHPSARYNLGCYEEANGNMERAVKHFIIAANLGHDKSMKELRWYYSEGNITKEKLDATLRGYQAAIDEMSTQEVGMYSEEDAPKSIDIHAAVIPGSAFRPKRWMVVLSYLVAAIIIICIGVAGAYSFVKASEES